MKKIKNFIVNFLKYWYIRRELKKDVWFQWKKN